jgi:hypothetical protein
MPSNTPVTAKVKHTLLKKAKVPDALSILDNTCSAAAQCQEVQTSPVAKSALTNLQGALTNAHTALTTKQGLEQSLVAANKALGISYAATRVALVTYETAVDTVAAGDASVIAKAGLLSRDARVPHAALGEVVGVRTKLGKLAKQAVVGWPEVAGATSYALQVNFTPTAASPTWTALASGSSRRRVITAPTAGAQFMVQIAAIASDGTQSAWSDAILATAR